MHIECFDKKMDQSPKSGQLSTTEGSHVPNVPVIRSLHCILVLPHLRLIYPYSRKICNTIETGLNGEKRLFLSFVETKVLKVSKLVNDKI